VLPAPEFTETAGLFTKSVPLIVTVWELVDPVIGFGLTLTIMGGGAANASEDRNNMSPIKDPAIFMYVSKGLTVRES